MIVKTFYVKPIICNCCIKIITNELENYGIKIIQIASGDVTLAYHKKKFIEKDIENIFNNIGFMIVVNEEKILVDKIKKAVIELIHFANNMNSIIRNTDYLVEKLDFSYFHLSALFSKYEDLTLDDFIELHKINKVKDCLKTASLTVSEIAYIMGYPNVIELDKKFEEFTGVSLKKFIKNPKMGSKLLIEI